MFDSVVRVERVSVAVRYVVGWLFGRDATSSKQRKIASSSNVKTVAVLLGFGIYHFVEKE